MVKFLPLYALALTLGIGLAPTSSFANFKYIPHAPVPVTGTESAPADMSSSTPIAKDYSVQPVMGGAMSGSSSTGSTSLAPMVRTTGNNTGGEVINGFGTQVPLVTAAREIVPASFQIAYAVGVPLGTPIDWNGGRPWRDVLQSCLNSLGLVISEQNAVVYISRAPGNG